MKISIVTSLYRSEKYIEEFHRACVEALRQVGADQYEVILVNDGSPGNDLAVARNVVELDPNVTLIDLSKNFGQHRALLTGMRHSTGDLVFILDSDLEEDPRWLVPFVAELNRTRADMVFGVQRAKKGRSLYRFGRWLFYALLYWLSDPAIHRDGVTARLMTRRFVDALMDFREREVFLAGLCHVTGFAQVPFAVSKTDTSETSYRLGAIFKMFITGVTAFTVRPLMMISMVGAALTFGAFAYAGWIVFRKLAYGITAEGWASVMVAVLLVGGVTLLLNGIIAIYVATIFIEVKARPFTIVRDVIRKTQP